LRRLDAIDALRGLAAIYVVVYHTANIPSPHLPVPSWAAKVVGTGGTGVSLFFVISAFSLYYTMPLRLNESHPRVSFYLHRFFRIAPLFYFLMLATWIRDYFYFSAIQGPGTVFSSLLFVFNFIPGRQTGYVWASWTIGVEMLFYLVFPFIHARVRNLQEALTLFVGALLLFMSLRGIFFYLPWDPASKAEYLQWTVFRHLPIFACGIVAFYCAQLLTKSEDEGANRPLGALLIVTAVYLYAALLNGWLPSILPNQYYRQGIIYACLTVGCLLMPLPIIVNRLTTYLGKLSYSIYLLHPTTVLFLKPVYALVYRDIPNVGIAFFTCYALTLAIVVALASLTYRFIEEPGVRLGKDLYRRFAATAAPRMAPQTEP